MVHVTARHAQHMDAAPPGKAHPAAAGALRSAPGKAHPAAASALAAAGIAFVAYPALRPYSDETTVAGAAAMASTAWVVSHLLGVAAFALLVVGLRPLVVGLRGERAARPAALTGWIGVVLVLPYYGAETFGAQVIAQRALQDGDASLLALIEDFRMGPVAAAMFGVGLVLLAATGILAARATWPTGAVARLGGLLTATGLLLYLPQFFAPAGVRIAHGVVLGTGLLLLAAVMWAPGVRRGR